MRLELVIYLALVLGLVLMVRQLRVPSLDHQVLYSCQDLIAYSRSTGIPLVLPCSLEEGRIYYGNAYETLPSTSHGVVVKGEHWTSP